MDRLQQQKLILENEIRVLEKAKRDTQFSLDSIDSQHKEAYSQHTHIIKELQKRKDDLIAQIDVLKEGQELLTSAFNQSKQSLESYKATLLRDLEDEITKKRQEARLILEHAVDTQKEANLMLLQAKEKEAKLQDIEQAQQITAKEQVELSLSLKNRLESDVTRHNQAENTVKALNEQIPVLTEQIRLLKEEKETIESDNKKAVAEREWQDHLSKNRLEEANRKEQANKNFDEMLRQQKRELDEKAILLADRQTQLDNAITEFRQKGVMI